MIYLASEILTFGTLLVLIIVLWIRWRQKKLKIFEDLGIPSPPTHFLFGNILEINEKGLLRCQEEWIKKYGQNVGYYHGLKPVLMITDKSILKRIFIKDFHLFSDRPEVVPLRIHSFLDALIPATQIMDSLLLNKRGKEWKRVRSSLSPVFSANKLKMMIPFVNKVCDVTIDILEEKARRNESIDIYQLLQCLTLDIICAQAFAVDTDTQTEGTHHPLFRSAKTIFDNPLTSKILTFGLSFPELGVLGMVINYLNMFFKNGFSIPPLKITNLVGKVIEQRRKNPKMRRQDILQWLIDASECASEDAVESELQENSNSDSGNQKTSIQNEYSEKSKEYQGLSEMEVRANALVVFLAGYETTSSALAYMIHMLMRYPEYQSELRKEIEHYAAGQELDYSIISNLQFMERFMKETMRLYPPGVPFVLRVATTDIDFGHLRIPKGMEITVPVNYMHFNEENWQNPEIFDPDRFLEEHRNDMRYWVFGIGPRNCLGARLSNITAKVVLAKLLQRFTFELPGNSEDAVMNVTLKAGTMVPDKVVVRVKERTTSSD